MSSKLLFLILAFVAAALGLSFAFQGGDSSRDVEPAPREAPAAPAEKAVPPDVLKSATVDSSEQAAPEAAPDRWSQVMDAWEPSAAGVRALQTDAERRAKAQELIRQWDPENVDLDAYLRDLERQVAREKRAQAAARTEAASAESASASQDR